MELAKIIEKTNKKTGQNMLEVAISDTELYRYVFTGQRTFTINDIGLYEIMHDVMRGWLLNNIKNLNCPYVFLPELSLEGEKSYNIEEIMKAYDPCPPLVISTIARFLLGNSDVVIEFCEKVFTHWKCYSRRVFEEELKKNTKEALQRYITALNILACNLPVFILICAKEQKKTK